MSRFLQVFNFVGVVAVAALCCAQWSANRRLNLNNVDLENTRLAQQAKIDEQDKTIKGDSADLDDFRQRLTLSEAALKDAGEKFTALAAERDQLKAALDKWIAVVAQRDAALKEAGERLQKVIDDRNAAITKFNDLAEKYNALVKQTGKSAKQ